MIEHKVVYYSESEKIYFEEYLEDGQFHRLDGPAFISYYNNGQKAHEQYYKKDVPHRIGGPAHIWYYGNGQIESEEYYIDGVKYTDIFQYSVAAGSLEGVE